MAEKAKENEQTSQSPLSHFCSFIQILNWKGKTWSNFFSTIYMSTMSVFNRVVPFYLEV